MTSATGYQCSSYHDGAACTNDIWINRVELEASILGPIRKELLAPERVTRMAKEMQAYYAERVRAMQTRASEVPRELEELTVRIERLRERLRKGDPDITADELEAALERAVGKRRELESQQPEARASAKVLSVLPKAAEHFRRQVEQGLDGDPRAALKARVILRELLGGRIDLRPEGDGDELWAEYGLQPAALLKVVGNSGSGGVICTNSTAVAHFPNIDRRKIRREDIPSHCGRGHPLTPDNLRIDRSEQRWRCLQCGRDHAAAFRRRHGRAA